LIGRFLLYIPIFLITVFAAYSQCPTVNNPTQSFCDTESVLVSDLQAIDNGNGIVWYDTATSTEPLNSNAGLNNGEDYYADDNSGTCGSRQRVEVVILGPPTGQNFQGVCLDDPSNATVANLVAIGNDIQWYLQPTGGVALDESTVLMDNTLYYADQSNPDSGCRTSRLSVLVNVGSTPVPEGETTQDFCVTDTFTPTVGDLVASGLNNWYPTLFSAVPLALETPLIDGQTYYATTVDPPCESSGRLAVFIELTEGSNAGEDATLSVCETEGQVNLFTILGGSPDPGGTWSPELASGTGLFDPAFDAPGVYTYSFPEEEPCPETSATVMIEVGPAPIPGENSEINLCTDSAVVDLFDSLGGSPQPGGTWSPALSSGSGIFNPSIDPEGVYTYTVTGVGPCEDLSASVTVSVAPLPSAGTGTTIEVCDNIDSIDLFDRLGGNPDSGGTWSPALNSGTGLFDPSIDSAGVYTYTVTGSAPCPDDSATVTITLTPFPDAGLDGAIELCSNDSPIDLFNSLEGTPQTGGTWSPALASGSGLYDPMIDPPGNYTYTLVGTPPCPDASSVVSVSVEIAPNAGNDGAVEVCSDVGTIDLFNSLSGNPDTGGTWSPSLNSGTGFFDPDVDTEGTYTYTLPATSICSGDSANVTVTIVPFLDAGTDGAVELCSNDNPINLFDSLGGDPLSGGVWTPTLNSGTGIFDPGVDTAGIYTYTLEGTASCTNSSADVTVLVENVASAGTDGSVALCNDSAPIDLFNSLGETADTGGVWSPALNSGSGVFDPTIDVEGTYTYTQVSTSTVCEDDVATVSVTVTQAPNAGGNASINLCSNQGTVNLFESLNGNPDPGGFWSPPLISGTGIFDPAIDTEGNYTYTLPAVAPCETVRAIVSVSIENVPEAGSNGNLSLCQSDDTVDLFDSLNGNPTRGGSWSPTLTSGTGIFDPALDAEGLYTYSISSTSGDCPVNTATVNVTLTGSVDAGEDASVLLCTNDGLTDLFDSLGGNPDAGGTWSPALLSGSGVFNPDLDAGGTYTYTVLGAGNCPDASAVVSVTVENEPNAGNDGSVEICNDNQINLFNFLGGNPDAGGSWSPPLITANGIFDPTLDSEGIYTYQVFSDECNLVSQAAVEVTFGETPDLTGIEISSESDFCLGTDVVVTVSGADQLSDGNYTIIYELTGENSLVNSVDIEVISGISFFNISGNLFVNPGITSISIIDFFFNPGECSGNTAPIAPIQVNIDIIEIPTLIEEGATFCEEDEATIQDLSNNINGIGTIVWYDAAEGGTIYENNEPLVDGQIYYGAFVSENECESAPRLEATVVIDTCILELMIPDGFSPNDDGINDDFNIVNINELFPNFKLIVFNRYGKELYVGDASSPRWNGTSKNGDGVLPVGVYFYVLEFNDGVRPPQQGRVYLSR